MAVVLHSIMFISNNNQLRKGKPLKTHIIFLTSILTTGIPSKRQILAESFSLTSVYTLHPSIPTSSHLSNVTNTKGECSFHQWSSKLLLQHYLSYYVRPILNPYFLWKNKENQYALFWSSSSSISLYTTDNRQKKQAAEIRHAHI